MKIGITSEQLNRPLTGRGYYIYNLINLLSKSDKNNIYLINYQITNRFPNLEHIIIPNPFKKISKSYKLWYFYLSIGLNNISKKNRCNSLC